jgi:DNA-binding NarL/FixJ family response regulator
MIKVAIADDHAVFAKGLKACLEPARDLAVTIEARNGQDLLQQLPSAPVDIVLMDVRMPVMDGIQATARVREAYSHTRVLALSGCEDERTIVNMIAAGANGYLLKTAAPEEIVRAIRTIFQSNYYFNAHLSLALLRQFSADRPLSFPAAPFPQLNPREKEVLKLVCEENSNIEIAEKLYVSPRTVEGYRSRLIEKCGAKNMAGLVLFAVRRGIVAT